MMLRESAELITTMPATYLTYPGGGRILPVERARARAPAGAICLDAGYLWSFGAMLVPRDLWRALQRFAAWVEPALIAEWTRLMRGYAAGQGRSLDEGRIASAMTWSDPDRDVGVARSIALSQLGAGKTVHCVWTGKRLDAGTLDIDHCLPCSARPCGDLWNLMPPHRRVNQHEKRDRLPSGEMLQRSASSITDWWMQPTSAPVNRPTRLDFGAARIIVLNLEEVAPTGSGEADRQTDLMDLLGRHILARNFFLKPKYAEGVPELVREFHTKRMTEIYETTKRLEYDEFHRTKGRRFVRAQVELDRREGRKHNLQLGLSSQKLDDFGDDLISQSTGRFILGAGDDKEADEIVTRFRLSDAASEVIRHRLKGPSEDGSGAPFLVLLNADNVKYEQMLVNSLGPVELWAFSTTPDDVNLRSRLYKDLGFSEGLRRLSRVFPTGTARKEIERRKLDRLRRGEEEAKARAGVVEDLATELSDARGIGMILRQPDPLQRDALRMPALDFDESTAVEVDDHDDEPVRIDSTPVKQPDHSDAD